MNLDDESTGSQAPPSVPVLCIKKCGFYGAASTLNMCSVCYKNSMIKQEQPKVAASSTTNAFNGKSKEFEPVVSANVDVQVDPADLKSVFMNSFFPFASQYDPSDPRPSFFTFGSTGQNNGEVKPPEGKKRCTSCNKKVGLTGFSCRCGDLFCGVHRYPEKHDCSYDYRFAGREVLAKENPLVNSKKLDKIGVRITSRQPLVRLDVKDSTN